MILKLAADSGSQLESANAECMGKTLKRAKSTPSTDDARTMLERTDHLITDYSSTSLPATTD